jgi:hypothetical protein
MWTLTNCRAGIGGRAFDEIHAIGPCPFQTHTFYLDSDTDYLYNAAGAGIRRDPTGRSGSYVGTEFDIIPNIHISNHQDILFSYSYMIAGHFLRNTATTPAGRDNPQGINVQYSIRW